MPKMIWLYRCTHCRGEMATKSAFTRDESPPAKSIDASVVTSKPSFRYARCRRPSLTGGQTTGR